MTHHLLLADSCSAAKSLQSCPTLCDPIDGSPPGSSVPGILQARTLEWVAISFSRGSSWPRDQTHVSCISCTGKWILSNWPPWEVPYIESTQCELLRRFINWQGEICDTTVFLVWGHLLFDLFQLVTVPRGCWARLGNQRKSFATGVLLQVLLWPLEDFFSS